MKPRVRATEPAVEAEPATEPVFLPEREAWKFCVTPKEQYQWIEPRLAPPSVGPRQLVFDVNCTNSADSSQFATLQTAFTVFVRELRYPGRPTEWADPAGKWVYVFRDGKLAVEARCAKGDIWDGWTVTGNGARATRLAWRSVRGVQLDPGPSGRRYTYSYLLSPVQLCREVIDDIESGKLQLGAAECRCDRYDKLVLLPDPLRWACDVQEQYYQPRLRTLQAWEFDEGLVAYNFVAQVLKAWIDNGDKVGVKKQLDRAPESWLDKRAAGIAQARREAEEAAAYLAHCIRAPEYAAVEKSCRIRGGEDLELVAVCLAAATSDILQTLPGRRLALDLVADPQRLPRQLLFQDDGPKLPDEWFQRYRYGQRGLFGIFRELVPASIELALLGAKKGADQEEAQRALGLGAGQGQIEEKVPRFEEDLALKERARKHLENLGAKTRLSKRKARILENLQKNKPVATGTRRKGPQWRKMMAEWEELSELEEVKHAPKVPTKAEAKVTGLEQLAKRYAPYEKFAKGLTATLGTVVEVINLTIAIEELRGAGKADANELSKKRWSAVGAVADMMEHSGGMTELLLRDGLKEIKKKELERVVTVARFAGSFAGMIGGVIDMLDYEEQVFAAAEEYDYGKLVGRSMQMAGAAGASAGSAMVCAGIVLEGGALGSLGGIVGAVGGAFVAGGFLVAKWLSLNANQVFASRCFLGKYFHEVDTELSWSGDTLPSRDPRVEASVLVELLSQFQLSCFADLGDWRVFIHPGYLDDGSTFEVEVANRWANAHPEDYSLIVDLDQDEVRQLAGTPLKRGRVKHDDATGEMEYILINTEAAQPPINPLRQYRGTTVRVRLMHLEDGEEPVQRVPGKRGTVVEIRLPSTDPVFSLDPSSWVLAASSPKESK